MKTITKIEANRSAAVYRKCRVAAYCRVSTEHDDQIESQIGRASCRERVYTKV